MKRVSKYFISILFPLLFSSFAVNAQQGKLIWADLYTGDVQGSIDFYTDTFG